ncbi:pullulanase [Streptococcus saliviloxodontae]|uniref:pullulanase n=1 Tax=Streptococcus saliviloxodontae TaxID=1349416 RepID=A0ABS2PLH5_9STRE|nr:pullulanase [Streptococcus saliviloxodontae]MBM7636290.1 secreted pullulanase [Streptococcus saliviloxodontae]
MTYKKSNKLVQSDKKVHYAIRTLKVGVTSVAISSSVLFLSPFLQSVANAEETTVDNTNNESLVVATTTELSTSIEPGDTLDQTSLVTESTETPIEISTPTDTLSLGSSEIETSATSVTDSSESDGQDNTEPVTEPQKELNSQGQEDPIKENNLRLHFEELPTDDISTLGLWTWKDVAEPSQNWPTGATSFSTAKKDSYGYYLDVPLNESKHDQIGFLINNTKGDNLSQDRSVDILSPKMTEAWIDKSYGVHSYEPLAEGTLRINYYRTDGQYDKKSLWTWGDVTQPSSGTFPDGTDFVTKGQYGYYIDVPLTKDAKSIGFLLLDENKTGDDAKIRQENYNFTDLTHHSQLFLKDDDPNIYTNPYYINTIRMLGAQHISQKAIQARFTNLDGADKDYIITNTKIADAQGQAIIPTDLDIDNNTKTVTYYGDFRPETSPYQITYNGETFETTMNWQLKDELYHYDGPLGATLSSNGNTVDLTLWSPSAEQVNVIIYDKYQQDTVVGKIPMSKGQSGTWQTRLTPKSGLSITDYRGYFYHYEIIRNNQSYLVLDPYAKSLAAWNSDTANQDASHKVAKAAFVSPEEYGPKGLTFANIPGFTSREKAIIYEAHVRDFTSDPAIANDLDNPFGTFSAFAEKLDYLKDLGVTHIQLLPTMSYYNGNEYIAKERLSTYTSSNSNYNWGYDPQSYFALSGMYSSDPSDPSKRIEEFKQLVNEIHKRGMGVILDVVYNHTALLDIFEDIEPNYYHFMDADGSPRTSFGGGRLGTTHYMSRRVLVDSINYLVDTYKVDGFRFDMMGDHDATSIEMAYESAKQRNPNIIMLGEGWITYAGDENLPQQPADQTWMAKTNTVAVFSDDIRNSLKSGYPSEGTPAFITGGAKNSSLIFNDIKAQPNNFTADDPGDVIQYIAAHDNLTLFDVIAQSIKKDPSVAQNTTEIQKRLRLGNLLILTAQGTPFLHSGQEYGRTKQFLDPAYETIVSDDKVPNKSHLLVDQDGKPFKYPYFIHDSYDSSDSINRFDWTKATDRSAYPEHTKSHDFTKGLIALRRSTDAFSLETLADVTKNVSLLTPENTTDLIIAYQTIASNGDSYAVFVNADTKERFFNFDEKHRQLAKAQILVDSNYAGTSPILQPQGVTLTEEGVSLAPLTATILRLTKTVTLIPQDAPLQEEKPQAIISFKRYLEKEQLLPETKWQYDETLPKGEEHLLQIGKSGLLTLTYEDHYINNQLVEHKLISSEMIESSPHIWLVGTKVEEASETLHHQSNSESASDDIISINNLYNTEKHEELPHTGDQKQNLWSLAGFNLLASLSFLRKRRTKKD